METRTARKWFLVRGLCDTITGKDEVMYVLRNIFGNIGKKKPDAVSVHIDRIGPSLIVHLCVNDRRRAWINCVIESDAVIMIGDIIHDRERGYNKGYGTMMMEKLIAYAKENDYEYIYGNLSVDDLGHKERLHHFYRKFGFIVVEYAEPQDLYYGKIELHL